MCSCGTTDLDCFSVLIHCCKLYVHHRSAGCVTSIWFPEVSFSDQQVRVSCGKSGCFGPRCQQLCCLPSGLEGSRSDCSPLGVSDLRSSAAGPFPPTPPWPGSNFVKYTTAPLYLCDRINCLQWRSLCRVTPDRRESSKSLITTLFLFPSAAESQKWPSEEKKTGPRLRPHRDHSNNRCVFRLHWCVCFKFSQFNFKKDLWIPLKTS